MYYSVDLFAVPYLPQQQSKHIPNRSERSVEMIYTDMLLLFTVPHF